MWNGIEGLKLSTLDSGTVTILIEHEVGTT